MGREGRYRSHCSCMIVSLLVSDGVEAAQARLLAMGFHCQRFSRDSIRELNRTSSELVYLVPEVALNGEDWPELRVRLAQANRYYVVVGSNLRSASIMRAARDGAFDVLLIEDDNARWSSGLQKVVDAQRLWLQVYGGSPLQSETLLLGESPAMKSLRQSIERLGPSGATILIQGESGVGKELAAIMLHQASGKGAFVALNCAAIPKELLEAELFGVERGAYTGSVKDRPGLVEQAADGTLFLDEIGTLDLSLQPKLLRFLETRQARRVGGANEYQVNVRLISATNIDMETAVETEVFRADLYYRLSEVTLHVPPLRTHLEDIGLLALAFARKAGERFGKHFESVEPELVLKLQQYHWPGNVRELKNVIDRMVILYDGPFLRTGWWEIPQTQQAKSIGAARAAVAGVAGVSGPPGPAPAYASRKQKLLMAKKLLEENADDLSWVAAQLGIHSSTLYRWRKAKKV